MMKRLHSLWPCFLLICLLACNQNNIPELNQVDPTIPPATESRPTATIEVKPEPEPEPKPKAEPEPEPMAVATIDTVNPDESTPLVYSPNEGPSGPADSPAPDSLVDAPNLAQSTLANIDPSNKQITLWHEYSPELEDLLLQLVAEFNLANEYKIMVVAEQMAQDSSLYNKMLTAITEKELPDLLVTTSHDMGAYQNESVLVDLTTYMEDAHWGLTVDQQNDYVGTFLASDYHPLFQQQLGFPISRSMDVMYINLDLLRNLGFDHLPTTWEGFATMACSARKAGYIGYELTTDARPLIAMILSRGGNLIAEDYSYYTLYEPEAIETMTWLNQLVQEECATLQPEPDRKWQRFGTGEVLFTIDRSDHLPIYQSAVAQGYQGVWSIGALPHSTSAPIINSYGKSFSIVKGSPESELAAWLFVKWFTDSAQQARWIERSHTLPVRQSVNDQLDAYLVQHPSYQISLELQPYGQPQPAIINSTLVHDLLTEVMVEILQGADLTETLTDVNDEANEMLGNGD